MSYIQSTSNPESLYIYGDGKLVHIIKGSEQLGSVPVKIFDGLLKKYRDHYHVTPCKYKGASIDEIHDEENTTFKMKFTYKDIQFLMWGVTWDCIVYENTRGV